MSNFIPAELIEEIRRKTDIVDLVSQYVVLKKRGRNYVGLCPFHNEDTPSFTVSMDKEIFYCFGCHKGGNAINFLMEIEHIPFPEAVERLAERVGIEIPKRELSPSERAVLEGRQIQYAIHKDTAEFFHKNLLSPKGVVGQRYCEKRGIPRDMAERFYLGYASDSFDELTNYLLSRGYSSYDLVESGLIGKSEKNGKLYDKFRNRFMFPITNYKGQYIAFGGRVLDGGEPKYLNSPATKIFDKSETLFALFLAADEIRKQDRVIIMEGYMDVLTAHMYGVTNAVASLGTAFTKEHGEFLKRYTTRVILAYDGDGAGKKAAIRGMEILREQGFEITIVEFPKGDDPDDFFRKYGKEGWERLVSNRGQGYLEYKLNLAAERHDINSIAGKSKVVELLLPDIVKSKNQVERSSFIDLMAKKLDVDIDSINADLQKLGYKNRQNKVVQGRTPVKHKIEDEKTYDRLCLSLVHYMISNKDVYEKVKKTIGFSFINRQSLQELLGLVENLNQGYNWEPVSLLTVAEDENVKKVLLYMLQRELEPEEIPKLADGCIRAIKIEQLQGQCSKLMKDLGSTLEKDKKEEILKEIVGLQQQIREYRSLTDLEDRKEGNH